PSPGNAADPNAPPRGPCGCTPPSGAGTSPPTPPGRPGRHGPGTPPRPHRASSTPSPRSAACCGRNELPPCPAREPRNRKSPTPYSTRSPTPHRPNPRVRKSTHSGTTFPLKGDPDDGPEAGLEGAWRCPRIVGGVGKSYARLGYGVCQPRTLVPGGRPRHGGPEEPSRTCMNREALAVRVFSRPARPAGTGSPCRVR